jgi:hypothetical protein
MILLAFAVLSLAVVIGSGLAIQFMRGKAVRRLHWAVGLVHALVGIAGMVPLVIVVRRGAPASAMGTGSFAAYSAGLFGSALILGLVIALYAWRRRPPGIVVGAHASLAIAGYVLLLVLATA